MLTIHNVHTTLHLAHALTGNVEDGTVGDWLLAIGNLTDTCCNAVDVHLDVAAAILHMQVCAQRLDGGGTGALIELTLADEVVTSRNSDGIFPICIGVIIYAHEVDIRTRSLGLGCNANQLIGELELILILIYT